MKRARVLTPWSGTGSPNDPAMPAVAAYTLETWADVTAQPLEALTPEPNLCVVEIVCEDAVLEAIAADATYEVLWDEEYA